MNQLKDQKLIDKFIYYGYVPYYSFIDDAWMIGLYTVTKDGRSNLEKEILPRWDSKSHKNRTEQQALELAARYNALLYPQEIVKLPPNNYKFCW